jgi:carboxyl-terminal processing protease
MKLKDKSILLTSCVLIFFSIAGMKTLCMADEKTTYAPLFPVRIDHEFSKSRETFEEVKNLILHQYYSDAITEEALYWAAINGMLRHISPPEYPELSKIWIAEEYEKIFQSLNGIDVSIGIKCSFNPNEGSLTITDVLPNSPAETILKPLDRILRIDTQQLKGKSLEEVNILLKGKEGSEVTLTVNRDIKIFNITIKRRKFNTESLIVSRLTDTIALVEIKKLTTDISKKFRNEMETLKKDGFKGLIIDLRNNTGGVFAEPLRIAEFFLPAKCILLRTLQRKNNLQNYVSVNAKPFEFKIAILVNKKTASAAEILACILQDHQKAIIIGSGTFGKGVFEKTFTLKNDFRVKFITGAVYSPKGHNWQGKGITPDFLVEQDENTLAALLRMEPKLRFSKDVSMITAHKLLLLY